jgi:putative ABC transport system permease protein
MFDDTRYALRALRNAPAFTLAAVVTIALGVAASTAIFSMVNGVLLRRLPLGVGDRFVHLSQPSAQNEDEGFSVLEVRDLSANTQAMSGVAEFHSMSFQLYGYGEPLRVQTNVVSDKFFDLLGVKPLLGRTFRPGEEAVGAPPVVVLTHKFWMNQFHGDPSIIGAKFTMNDKVHTVVGVLPAMPGYPNEADMFMPAGACPFRSAPVMMDDYSMRMVGAFAVLRPGVSLERARAELATLAARNHAAHPEAYPAQQRLHYDVTLARDEMTARAKPILYLLFGTAAFLLLAAIANVANLTLSRQMHRAREVAVRVALGAPRTRIYRQLALESLYVSLAGGAIGVALAAASVGLLRATATRLTPRADEIRMSPSVYLFALVLCVATALFVAAVPFIQSARRRNVADALRQGNTGAMATRGEHRLRNVLVVAQVALAFVMLVGAGLIARSLVALSRIDAGIEVHNVLTARLTLNFTKYNSGQLTRNFAAALLDRLNGMPGTSSVALASTLPLGNGQTQNIRFQIEGASSATKADMPHSDATSVSPEYFKTIGVPLLRGRDFTTTDRDTNSPPAIVSQRLAKSYWRSRDPIGTRISADSGRHWLTVVGVVGDVRMTGLDKDVTDEIYVPLLSNGSGDVRVFLRTTGAMPPVVNALRAAVHSIDSQQPVASVQTLEQVRGAQLAEPRLTASLLIVFAVVALILTATGLAGVIGYGVTQRLPEISIRLALGASASRVLLLVMRQGLAIVVIGLSVGLAVALEGSSLVTKLLFHVAPTDLLTYAGVGLVILTTAAIACFLPSRRALQADPARVFRAGGA